MNRRSDLRANEDDPVLEFLRQLPEKHRHRLRAALKPVPTRIASLPDSVFDLARELPPVTAQEEQPG